MLKNSTTISQDPYLLISYSAEQHLFHCLYYPETRRMTSDEYRSILHKMVELGREYQPKYLIHNSTDFDYIITPDEQTWIAAEIFPVMAELGISKVAIVVPDDVFALLSMQQTADEAVDAVFEVRYFKTEEQAFEWLSL